MMRLKAGDTAPTLTVNTNADLTGATAVAKLRRVHDGTVVTKTLTITDPANGVCQYAWQTGDTDTPGYYLVEALVTFSGGSVQRFPQGSYMEVLILPKVG